jgi:hypothetical protein
MKKHGEKAYPPARYDWLLVSASMPDKPALSGADYAPGRHLGYSGSILHPDTPLYPRTTLLQTTS